MDYYVAGRTAATAATANHAGAALWNPHASIRLQVREIHWFKTVATVDNIAVVRISARGTAGSTVTPTIGNSSQRGVAPTSGALLDLATYSAQPTITDTIPLLRANFPAAIASGAMFALQEPIEIPPGAGLAIVTPVATILQPADVMFRWTE